MVIANQNATVLKRKRHTFVSTFVGLLRGKQPYLRACLCVVILAPAERTKTKFSTRGHVADVIICFKFY